MKRVENWKQVYSYWKRGILYILKRKPSCSTVSREYKIAWDRLRGVIVRERHSAWSNPTHIFNSQLSQRGIRIRTQRRFRHSKFLMLQLYNLHSFISLSPPSTTSMTPTDLIFYTILYNQLHHLDRSLLSQSVNPVHRLILDRRVPP
jgi:hypothetical protein